MGQLGARDLPLCFRLEKIACRELISWRPLIALSSPIVAEASSAQHDYGCEEVTR